MSVTATQKTAGGTTTDASSYVSGNYNPTAAGLSVLIPIAHNQTATGIGDATSVTGPCITGATRLSAKGYATTAAATQKVELWVATSTATQGAVTVALPGSPTGCSFSVNELTGVSTATGTKGIVQTINTASDSASSLTVTLGAFAQAANATFAVFAGASLGTYTPKSGWTELRDAEILTPNMGFEVQFIASSDTTPSATVTGGNQAFAGIACEIASTAVLRTLDTKVNIATSAEQGVVLQYR